MKEELLSGIFHVTGIGSYCILPGRYFIVYRQVTVELSVFILFDLYSTDIFSERIEQFRIDISAGCFLFVVEIGFEPDGIASGVY